MRVSNLKEDSHIWKASEERYKKSYIFSFMAWICRHYSIQIHDWQTLYNWSIEDTKSFWEAVAKFTKINWKSLPSSSFENAHGEDMFRAKWFINGKLNYAENLLSNLSKDETIVSFFENQSVRRLNSKDLIKKVAILVKKLRQLGFKKGDVAAGVLTNTNNAIEIMLAVTACGGVWSSCSPDFGYHGINERLNQISPKLLFFSVQYYYNGKSFDCHNTLFKCFETFKTLEKIFILNDFDSFHFQKSRDFISYDQILKSAQATTIASYLDIDYEEMNFDDPLYIMFSSGTTGAPKCIVHTVGGTLLQHKKEHMLHCDIQALDKMMFFTTCGWMMWNWMVSALAVGAKIVTFEGCPSYSDPELLWKIADEEDLTVLGISPKYIDACIHMKISPRKKFRFRSLKTILSTGAPLLNFHYRWLYQNIKQDLFVSSISGGTDIISCFMLGNLMLPVYPGEIQAPGLGMKIQAWNNCGQSVTDEKAELVCTKPFVSMPKSFMNDPDNKKYFSSYFSYFKSNNVWRHGDYIEINSRGGIIVHGRSDTTLNRGGVRIGTAEIYGCFQYIEEIEDGLAISKNKGSDLEILLFIKLIKGCFFNDALKKKIVNSIRKYLSPRHVPNSIYCVEKIPYTKSGKKLEILVHNIINGHKVENLSSLKDPNDIKEYYFFAQK